MEKVPVERRREKKNNLFLVAYLILLLVLLLLLLLLRCYVGEYIVALVASSIKPEVETADMSTQQSASSLFFSVVRFLLFFYEAAPQSLFPSFPQSCPAELVAI
jgi:hypothetical protein